MGSSCQARVWSLLTGAGAFQHQASDGKRDHPGAFVSSEPPWREGGGSFFPEFSRGAEGVGRGWGRWGGPLGLLSRLGWVGFVGAVPTP